MASSSKKERHDRLCREVLEGAPDFILTTGIDGAWIDYLCRHYGYSSRRITHTFPTKGHVIDFILLRHLEEAFEAVCVPGDWEGPPMDVLRAMSLALICYGSSHLARHRVFLGEYERRPMAARQSLAEKLIYLTNNFQVALHAVVPRRSFRRLGDAAGLLLGQLLHAPLWWPSDTGCRSSTTQDAWVCTQLGLLTGLKRPDHRRPSAARRITSPDETG